LPVPPAEARPEESAQSETAARVNVRLHMKRPALRTVLYGGIRKVNLDPLVIYLTDADETHTIVRDSVGRIEVDNDPGDWW
jgi:hypothetical protein